MACAALQVDLDGGAGGAAVEPARRPGAVDADLDVQRLARTHRQGAGVGEGTGRNAAAGGTGRVCAGRAGGRRRYVDLAGAATLSSRACGVAYDRSTSCPAERYTVDRISIGTCR